MQKYVIIHLLQPLEDGSEFNMRDWPLHVTLSPRFSVDIDQPGFYEALQEVVRDYEPVTTTVKNDEHFGQDAHVHVAILERTEKLIQLHNHLLDVLESFGATFDEPMYSRDGYRPHVTVQRSGRVHKGDEITINSLSLIDMFNKQDIKERAVIHTFKLGDKL